MSDRIPPALRAAGLEHYADTYGASVYELDVELGEAPHPAGTIDLTHGDTRAFPPAAAAVADLEDAVRENDEAYTAYRGSVPASFRINFSQDAGRLFEAVDRIASVLSME